jgi:hypothetical protein
VHRLGRGLRVSMAVTAAGCRQQACDSTVCNHGRGYPPTSRTQQDGKAAQVPVSREDVSSVTSMLPLLPLNALLMAAEATSVSGLVHHRCTCVQCLSCTCSSRSSLIA